MKNDLSINKDLKLFARISNRLIFLTTRDEYGSSRSQGIETFLELYDDLNNVGIIPPRGYWTENSLKIFLHRVKKNYDKELLREVCDLEFIGTSAWEYQSHTKGNEIMSKGHNTKTPIQTDYTKAFPLYTYQDVEGTVWKEHETNQLKQEDKIILKKTRFLQNNLKRIRHICH